MSETNPSERAGKPPERRKLLAIVYMDMVGYSRLIGLDDASTLSRLRNLRATVIDPAIAEHGGKIVQTGGDSLLIVFDSVDGAVRCAVQVQQQVPTYDSGHPHDRTIHFRIGINLGDAIADGTDLHGDAVNVVARLQAEAPPGGICVSRSVRDHVHDRLNFSFEELGSLILKNITRPVEAFLLRPDTAAPGLAEHERNDSQVLPSPDRPSIAVLAFTNMSGDPDQDYFSDGMVEEIINALSRIRWLFVTARNSSFTYKGQSVDVKRVGRELGVRYVLEGSVRKASGRVRIAAQLIETASGAHLWSDRFDGLLEDVFDLQDRVAISVAGVIEPTLQVAEVQRASRRPTGDLAAHDLCLRAYAMMLSPVRQYPQILELLDQAVARDPDYGPALAWAAMCHYICDLNGWRDDREDNWRTGLQRGRRAVQVAGDDPFILANAAFALSYFGEDIDTMIALVDRALSLNPGFARGWHASGVIRLFSGQSDLAITHIENSLRLSPRARVGWGFSVIGSAHLLSRRYDEALPKLLIAIQEDPNFPHQHRLLAACYAQMGLRDEARKAIERLRTLTSVIVPITLPYRNSQHREVYLSGLRLALDEEP